MGRPSYWRIEKLAKALETRRYGMTLEEMAEEVDTSRRTAERYRDDLLERGWIDPGEPDDKGRKRWVMTAAARKRVQLSFTGSELFAQRIALQAALPLVEGTEIEQSLTSIMRQIEGIVPPAQEVLAKAAAEAFPIRSRARRAVRCAPEVIEDLLQACVQRRVIRAGYAPASHSGKPKEYRLKPLAVINSRGFLYLLAMKGDDAKIRRFLIDRFRDVNATNVPFDPPPGFSAKKVAEESFGIFDGDPIDVCVRFSHDVAPVVRERTWHVTQTQKDLPNGDIEVRFRACGWPEIRAWVLSYGEHAELIEPKDRRRELAAELKTALKRYGP